MLNRKTAADKSIPNTLHNIPGCDWFRYAPIAERTAPAIRVIWRAFPRMRRSEIRRLYRDSLYTTPCGI